MPTRFRPILFITLLTLSFGIFGLVPRPAADQADEARAAITKLANQFVDAFQRGDADALAKMWAPDARYVDLDGRVLKGRDAIAADYRQLFASSKGLSLRLEVHSQSFPTPDVAIETGVSSVLGPSGTLPTRARYTNTLVRRDGNWLIWGVQENAYLPPSNFEHLRPLEWMIGEWLEDRDGEERSHVTFNWESERNFIVSRRSVLVGDTMLDSGMERIGWDAAGKRIRSWNFEADGGFGEGTWTGGNGVWSSRLSSVLSSGSVMTAVGVITVVDENSITWQMRERVVDGKPAPDSPVIKMKRVL